jgi:hypothetical protein
MTWAQIRDGNGNGFPMVLGAEETRGTSSGLAQQKLGERERERGVEDELSP